LKSIKVTEETVKNLNKASAETGEPQYVVSEKASKDFLEKITSPKKKKKK